MAEKRGCLFGCAAMAFLGFGLFALLMIAGLMMGPVDIPDAPSVSVEEQKNLDQAAEERVAEHREQQRKHRDDFMALLTAVGLDSSTINSVSVSDLTVTIKVTNTWHVMAYQNRLQAAQNLWEGWASVASPKDRDQARIKVVDLNGNEVGGSRILAGSLIWVQEK